LLYVQRQKTGKYVTVGIADSSSANFIIGYSGYNSINVIYLILGITGLLVSIGILRRFIRNWKTWNPPIIRIIGVILAVLGILLGLYAILGLYSFMVYVASPAAALL
jgi:hypothetical protein